MRNKIIHAGMFLAVVLSYGASWAQCTGWTLSSYGAVFSASGGSGTFNVQAPSSCGWGANPLNNPNWMTITFPTIGDGVQYGNGHVNYTVASNTGTTARNATIQVTAVTNQGYAYLNYTIQQAAPGRSDVVISGQGDVLHAIGTNGSWSAWQSLGSSEFLYAPAISSMAVNNLFAFDAGGGDGGLWNNEWTGSAWSGWASLGGPTGITLNSAPAAVSWGSGRMDVVARGSDQAVWHIALVPGSGWSGWQSLGGGFTSALAISSWGANQLTIVGIGLDGALYSSSWNGGTWSAWTNLGAPSVGLKFDPAAVSRQSGVIDVFAVGKDNAMWHNSYSGSWSGWQSLGGAFTTGPASSSPANNEVDVFGVGTDGTLYQSIWTAGVWSAWQQVPDYSTFTSAPSAVSWNNLH
jgi:hypothetical protein